MGRASSVVVLLLVACGPRVPIDDSESTSSSDGSASATTSPTTTVTTSTTVGMTTSVETSTTGVADTGGDVDDTGIITTAGFICHCDGGNVSVECDIWAQDCPEGEKCMPWANDGGNTWNATRCSPLDPRPAGIFDPCTVEGSGVSGIDNCMSSSMCFGVDPMTNTGSCAALCIGSPADPQCPDGLTCFIGFDGTMPICLLPCDPLAPDCGADACALDELTGTFWCVPAILVGETAYAEDCEEAPFTCGSDFVCADAPNVPACATASCCTTRCDPVMPAPCPDEALGQTCLPLDVDPTVGYCGFPA